jgi:hypothetical protein
MISPLSLFHRPEYVRTRGTKLVPLKQEDINPINSAVALNPSLPKGPAPSALSPLHIESAPANGNNTNENRMKSGEGSSSHPPQLIEAASARPQLSNATSAEYDTFDADKNLPSTASPPVPMLGVIRQQTLGYDEFDGTALPSPVENEFDFPTEYDTFDMEPTATASKTQSLHPMPPVPMLGVMRQQTLGYDEFDGTALPSPVENEFDFPTEYDAFDELTAPAPAPVAAPTLPSANYDTFESVAPNQPSDSSNTKTENEEKSQEEGYGFFRNTMTDYSSLSSPPPSSPSLNSTPSILRMKTNRDFESNQMEEIINLLDRYRKFEINELEVESQQQDLITRQAYIEATVSDLYQEEQPSETSGTSGVKQIQLSVKSSPVACSPISTPLSPDALTAFSKYDHEAVDRNREVIRATDRLIHEIIPTLALQLSHIRREDLSSLDLSVYFHSHGVNIRHMGLVRSHIPGSSENINIRTYLLLNIVCRTLKNIAREFQRRWMKSEQSSSEQGILILLTQYLNLIVGKHINSDKFWSERVLVGIFQRFGKCALDGNDAHLQAIRKSPTFLTVSVVTTSRFSSSRVFFSISTHFVFSFFHIFVFRKWSILFFK